LAYITAVGNGNYGVSFVCILMGVIPFAGGSSVPRWQGWFKKRDKQFRRFPRPKNAVFLAWVADVFFKEVGGLTR